MKKHINKHFKILKYTTIPTPKLSRSHFKPSSEHVNHPVFVLQHGNLTNSPFSLYFLGCRDSISSLNLNKFNYTL